MSTRFPIAFRHVLPEGHLVAVALPGDGEVVPATIRELLPEEQRFAESLPPARRTVWVGGRVALRLALEAAGLSSGPILRNARGAPTLPAGVLGSVSHKPTVAVALACAGDATTTAIGVDVEIDRPRPVDIARRVLCDEELTAIEAFGPDERRTRVLTVFSAKEALYKALDPFLGRFVSFQEAAIEVGPEGDLSVALRLQSPEPGLAASGRVLRQGPLIVSALCVIRHKPAPPNLIF